MKIKYGSRSTPVGSGVRIELSSSEVAAAIDAWLVAQGVQVSGPRTVSVNGEHIEWGHVYVDPAGCVIAGGEKFSGRGPDGAPSGVSHQVG